jgi:hypothetical protein
MTARWQDPGRYTDPDEGTPWWAHVLVVLEAIAFVIVVLGMSAR